MKMPGVLFTVFALASHAARAADESGVALKDGPDADLTRARCSICHSPDYIPMNSVFLTRAGWDAEVHKMMKVMGAPITDEEASRIVDYLAHHYGAD
jgi:uncharacterized membrane protein YecN with MAPEG domain